MKKKVAIKQSTLVGRGSPLLLHGNVRIKMTKIQKLQCETSCHLLSTKKYHYFLSSTNSFISISNS